MSASTSPAPIRPYTSYHLFFQLEREYILQTLLGYRPAISPNDIFHPDLESYPADAPPLPRRYANLVLPYDWHIPGKTKRRKRIHRKSHGKIGFHELNDRISKAWSLAENEVKNFCTQLSEIESAKYRKARKTTKLAKGKKTSVTNRIKRKSESLDSNDPVPPFDWMVNFPIPTNISQEDCAVDYDGTSTISSNLCRLVSRDSIQRNSYTEVDMEDDEIIDIWKSTPIEDKNEIHSFSPVSPFFTETVRQDDTRKSFIDSEYEKFKAIGQQFLTSRRMPSVLRRNSITACQA